MSEPPVKRLRWTFDEPCTRMEHTARSSPVVQLAGEDASRKADLTVVSLFGGEIITSKTEALAVVESEEARASLVVLANDFHEYFSNGNKVGTTTPVVRLASGRFVLIGLGDGRCASLVRWGGGIGLRIGSVLSQLIDEEKGCTTAEVHLPGSLLASHEFVKDMTQSLFHGLYSDNRYRSGGNKYFPAPKLNHLYLSPLSTNGGTPGTTLSAIVEKAVAEGRSLSQGQYLAMDIVNAPHNVLNSLSLANEARALADRCPSLTCTILDKHDCEKRGMGAYLGVARGSETELHFIHLVYRPNEGPVRKKIGVVGKGLLFDTGGYNIKTSMMELMKFDCGGAAAVFGAAHAIAALGPKGVEVHFIVAACENMIGPKAYVPSDILTASNGKTIEIHNTDAEGRLTLADALVYADKEIGCERIIELSTLTGSCMVSLGKQISGLWTTHDGLAVELEAASRASGEKLWRMPMAMEYNDQLESIIADCKNCGTKYGGAITAALFLQKFVEPGKPFAHIDIAGPAWHDKNGATGFGVKLITEWISKQK